MSENLQICLQLKFLIQFKIYYTAFVSNSKQHKIDQLIFFLIMVLSLIMQLNFVFLMTSRTNLIMLHCLLFFYLFDPLLVVLQVK